MTSAQGKNIASNTAPKGTGGTTALLDSEVIGIK
jgi:hypothetical protein